MPKYNIKIADKVFEAEVAEGATDIVIEDGVTLRTAEEEEQFITNLRSQAEKQGKELAIKDLQKLAGLEVDGKDPKKTLDRLQEHFTTSVREELSKEPDARVKDLTERLSIFEKNNAELESKYNESLSQIDQIKFNYELDRDIESSLPSNLAFPREGMKMVLKNAIQVKRDPELGKVVLDSQGNIMRDAKTGNPLDYKTAVNKYFEANPDYLGGAPTGRAEKDSSTHSGKMTTEQFAAKNQNMSLVERQNAYAEAVKSGMIDDSNA